MTELAVMIQYWCIRCLYHHYSIWTQCYANWWK